MVNNFDIPILFLVFNRLDTTEQVFNVIRKITPKKLYIASDGPRDNRAGEDEKVKTVRDFILNSINWECEIKTLFREKNLGCGKGPAEAITWFFEHVEMGIILEDDCVPSLSFFSYCEELLKMYQHNNTIYHIAGHNPLVYTKSPFSYYFARIQHCWGWATWRRAWKYYSYDIQELDKFIKEKKIEGIFSQKIVQNYWIDIFQKMLDCQTHIWDYQWTYAIFKNGGLCINPSKNMISNIGFNNDATHTLNSKSILNNQKRFEINHIKHPKKIQIKASLTKKINKIVFGISTFRAIKAKIPQFIKLPIKHILNHLRSL